MFQIFFKSDFQIAYWNNDIGFDFSATFLVLRGDIMQPALTADDHPGCVQDGLAAPEVRVFKQVSDSYNML